MDEIFLGNIRGPQGPEGPAGKDGIQGEVGPKGDKGDKGDTGDAGPKGEDGKQGVSGVYVGSGDMPSGYNVQIDTSDGNITGYETWTFTLSDGTVVTKQVLLK